jgi:hypothetical protein
VKNGALPTPSTYVYRREGALLVPAAQQPKTEVARAARPSREDRFAGMLALIPDGWTREETVRALVEHLLGSDNDKPATKRQRWHRALAAMERSSRIMRRDGMMRRRTSQERDN